MATGIFGDFLYDDPAKWQAAHDAWEAGGRQGPEPQMGGGGKLARDLGFSGFSPTLPNSSVWQQAARSGANAPLRANPYSSPVADQSRAAQLALINQMRAQQAGPSLAALQGQRGMAQAGQQGLMMGGRAGMLGAQNASTGMAGDIGQARLAEVLRSQAAMGGAAGNLRGGDLRSAGIQASMGNQQLQQDLANRAGYAGLGSRLSSTEDAARVELLKAIQRANLGQTQKDISALKTGASIAAGPFAGLLDIKSWGT